MDLVFLFFFFGFFPVSGCEGEDELRSSDLGNDLLVDVNVMSMLVWPLDSGFGESSLIFRAKINCSSKDSELVLGCSSTLSVSVLDCWSVFWHCSALCELPPQ